MAMEQKMNVVVLGANRYSFEDERTKREIEGCKVHYVSVGDSDEDNQRGMIPKSETMDYSYFNQLSQVPALYEATVEMKTSGKGLKVKITKFKFLEPVTFELPSEPVLAK